MPIQPDEMSVEELLAKAAEYGTTLGLDEHGKLDWHHEGLEPPWLTDTVMQRHHEIKEYLRRRQA